MVTLKQFYCEMKCFFGKYIKDNLETLINWLLVSSVHVLFLFWLPSLREYNAVGTTIKCRVAGFHLFVYSIASIVLNKLPLEICLVSWDISVLRGSLAQAPHISFWVTGTRFNTVVWFQYVIHTCETQTFPLSLGIGVCKTNCVPHTTHMIMKMISPKSPLGNLAALAN